MIHYLEMIKVIKLIHYLKLVEIINGNVSINVSILKVETVFILRDKNKEKKSSEVRRHAINSKLVFNIMDVFLMNFNK